MENQARRYEGWAFVLSRPGTDSLSQCDSGQFCIWSSTRYTGSFIYKTGQGVTRAVTAASVLVQQPREGSSAVLQHRSLINPLRGWGDEG